MNKKITRRVVLGTVIGGLAAAPFVVHSLRKGQENTPLQQADPYGKIDIPLEQVQSNLPSDTLKKCFDVIYRERLMWLRFRGAEGKVVGKMSYRDGKKEDVQAEGYLSCGFDYPTVSESAQHGELYPENYRFAFSKVRGGDPTWSFFQRDRSGNHKPEIKGENVEGMSYEWVCSLLLVATTTLTAYSNGRIEEIVEACRYLEHPDISDDAESFVLESDGDLTSDGGLIPTLRFRSGHLEQFISSRRPNSPFPVVTLRNVIEKNGIAFPQVISMHFESGGGVLPEQINFEFELSFQDLEVKTADV